MGGVTVRPVDQAGVLAGFTVAVTAERRREELAALLTRRGARVVTASAIMWLRLRGRFL